MLVPVISLAFLIVIASTAIYTPLLLYLFDLRQVGWRWEHGALFSAMISSTDAVAVAAILKKGEAFWHAAIPGDPFLQIVPWSICDPLEMGHIQDRFL